MYRDVFAKNVVVADGQPRRFILVFQILRCVADDRTGVKFVVGPDPRRACQVNLRSDHATVAQFHAGVNYGMWPDAHIRAKFRLRMDDGCWMNHFDNI